MTIMQAIAHHLGVKQDEEFIVNNECDFQQQETILRFHGNSLQEYKNNEWIYLGEPRVLQFIHVVTAVKKLPFIPNENEEYWYIDMQNDKTISKNKPWKNTFTDYINFYNNNCFRTFDQAEQNALIFYHKIQTHYIQTHNKFNTNVDVSLSLEALLRNPKIEEMKVTYGN